MDRAKRNPWNAMDWLKIIYEAIGPKYPIVSLITATLIGGLLFGGGWYLLGKQYETEHRHRSATGQQGAATHGQVVIPPKEEIPKPSTSEGDSPPSPPLIHQKSTGSNSPNIVTGDHGTVNVKQKC